MLPSTDTKLALPEAAEARRAYCQTVLEEYHNQFQQPTGVPGPQLPTSANGTLPFKVNISDTCPTSKIAIVGGGVAGLYAAMMIGVNCQVDVFEASDELGGRLRTHKFKNGGEWDYFDVGAMRFPRTELMKPTFDLFDYLCLARIPYKITQDENWLAFNLQRYRRNAPEVRTYATDPFHVGIANGGAVPDFLAQQSPSAVLHNALKELIDKLLTNRKEGIAHLMTLDKYSTRSYLMEKHNLDAATIDYLETMCFGTGWFDRALAETVYEELCFQYNKDDPADLDWYCVSGGSQNIIRAMEDKLTNDPTWSQTVTIKKKHRVTAAIYDDKVPLNQARLKISGLEWASNDSEANPVSFEGEYSHVIFAIPPPCLRTMDISTCKLDYQQRTAIRQVSVGPSCKIGIKFKTPWWSKQGINGGQSSTDRMARTIVYPSYGDGKSTVLIASYTWTQDAVALGALMGEPGQSRLKDLMLADLAHVHGLEVKFLEDQFEEMYPWDWSHHPNSMGAFGIFGPCQYQQFYTALTRSAADGHVHFIGETISTIHGWVAGALESAERGVRQLFEVTRGSRVSDGRSGGEVIEEFERRWKPNYGVDEDLLVKQLQISRTLQQAEFGQ